MSHLTVSYVSQTPAVTPAGTTAAAPAAGNPLGFLAALLDQLLAGGTDATASGTEAGAAASLPGLLNAAFTGQAATSSNATGPSDLLAALSAQLDKLQAQLGTGDAPPAGQLPRLGDAVDALIAIIDAPQPATPSTASTSAPAVPDEQITQLLASLGLVEPAPGSGQPKAAAAKVEPSADITALLDRLTALSRSLAATAPDLAQKLQTLVAKLEPVATNPALAAQLGLTRTQPDPDALTIAHIIRALLGHAPATDDPVPGKAATADPALPAANPAPQVHDNLLQVLATLGLNTLSPDAAPAAAPTDGAAATASTAVPAPLLRLSTQLTQVATSLAARAPALSEKLETVATRLVSADAGPELLGKVTSAAAQPAGTALDTLVQSLIDARPVTTATVPAPPQIAAATLPAPTAPKQSKSAVTEVKAAPPEPAPVTADSAPRPAVVPAAAAKQPAAEPKPEPKVETRAAEIVASTSKSDPAAPPVPGQPPPPVAAQQARPLPAAYQPVANPINMGQVAFEMMRQVHQGSSRFTIRLDPPEMGRVDVRMHVDATGAVNARLTVDRAETLDLFQRDRQSLERALSQAGLDTSRTNLEFSLRQQHNPFAGMMGGDQRQQQPGYAGATRNATTTDDATPMPSITLYRGTASAGGVNIFA